MSWGNYGYGVLGNGKANYSCVPVQAIGLSGVTAIAASRDSGLALKSDGTVWAWGSNAHGQLGNGTTTGSSVPAQVTGLAGVTAVATAYESSLALRGDGTVWAWGCNGEGELGNGTFSDSGVPVQVTGLAGVAEIAGGEGDGAGSYLAVKKDGTVWAWGFNGDGELGNGTTSDYSTVPVQVTGLTGVKAVAGGYFYSLALKSDGTVWAWGYNGCGTLGNGTTNNSSVPVQVSGLTGVTAVAAGDDYGLAVRSDGTVWTWGYCPYGALGGGTTNNSNVPVKAPGLTGVTAVSARSVFGLAIKTDGTVWTWGDNYDGELGNGSTIDDPTPAAVPGLSGVAAVAAGGADYDGFFFAVKNDGTVWSCGYNADGELGDGTASESPVPVQVTGLSGVTAIAAAFDVDLAVTSDGAVWAWGQAYDAGSSDGARSSVPVRMPGLSGITSVAEGEGFSLAVKNDGTAWAWGYNPYCELGNGTTTDSSVPVQVTGLTGVTAVAAAQMSGLALKNDGTVWAWGSNEAGELGTGSAVDTSSVPVQVAGLTGVTAVAGGSDDAYGGGFFLALRNDGTVWAWGSNGHHELGNALNFSSLPLQVQTSSYVVLSGVVGISAGVEFSLAVKNDGTVWAWGDNTYGELGNGTTTDSSDPVQVAGLSGITAVAAGNQFGLAVKKDGSVWGWGNNVYGQLGNGTTTGSLLPVPVAGLTGVTAVAAGYDCSLAAGPMISGISGGITPYGAVNDAQEVDFAFHNASYSAFTWSTTLGSDGSYVIPLAAGTYNVGINGSKWLRTTLTDVGVTGNIVGINAVLLPGDLNGDNVVDLNDFSLFAAAFGSAPGASSWNPAADLNCDGVVDMNDFSLFAQDFGLAGDPAP